MTENKHTPGPWRAEKAPCGPMMGIMAPTGAVAMLGRTEALYSADVALIAASPELLEVARLGVEMRVAQNRYFRDRSKENLIASKQAESAFDKAAKAVLAKVDG